VPRRTIWFLAFLYFIATMAFAAYEEMLDPFFKANARGIGRIIGEGLLIYAGGAIIPIIGWAVARFRSARAAAPVFFWLVFSCVLGYFSHVGSAFDRDLKIEKFVGEGLVGKDKEDFMRSTKLACEQQQRRNPTTKQVGISEANIVAYCDCYAAGASEAITKEEMRIMITTQKPPPSVADKATTMGQFCTEEIFGKKK
jgi:hypothetical protein